MNRNRSRQIKYNIGQKIGEWVLMCQLGAGGNGQVWRVSRAGCEDQAMKLLHKIDDDSYKRFKAEVTALNELVTLPGVVQMIDSYIPANPKDTTPWFVMPIGEKFDKYKLNKSPQQLVEGFIELSKTLSDLHDKKIHHRDIKPANILCINSRLCFSDFGLVKYPERPTITRTKQDVGAKYTMAPEMRRYASNADGASADVYSFSKTLWIALTGVTQGFDGQYTTSSFLSLKGFLPELYTTVLDQLLVECTDNDPSQRPPIRYVTARLTEWIKIVEDFHLQNLTEWAELLKTLFPFGAPERGTWSQIDTICSTLGEVAKVKALNHMFYPTGGGNTITEVSRAEEPGMIALHVGDIAAVLKPAKLTYESFGADSSWSYFRLEAFAVDPTGIEGALDREGICETLVELVPGIYISCNCWNRGEYQGQPLPDDARPITRYLKGSFVFFSTRSKYNLTPSTYDARHDKMTEDEFRRHIALNARRFAENGS